MQWIVPGSSTTTSTPSFVWNPSEATAAGIHDYDSKFADFSRSAHLDRIDSLTEFRERLGPIMQETLSALDRIDAEILDGRIQAELLDLRTLEIWRKNPINYVWVARRIHRRVDEAELCPSLGSPERDYLPTGRCSGGLGCDAG